MKLSTKGRYAVMAMVDLARHAQAKPVSLSDIATRQEISLSYLEQLFARLRQIHLANLEQRLPIRPAGVGSDSIEHTC